MTGDALQTLPPTVVRVDDGRTTARTAATSTPSPVPPGCSAVATASTASSASSRHSSIRHTSANTPSGSTCIALGFSEPSSAASSSRSPWLGAA